VLRILKALRTYWAATLRSNSVDWKNDWLYLLILREAEEQWTRYRPVPDADYWQYVLVEEFSSSEGSRCAGHVLRAWKRDEIGLRKISLKEHKQHERKLEIWQRKRDSRFFPYILVVFHVFPDRQRVVKGFHHANTAGKGGCYLVRGDGTSAKLIPDPDGGFWVS
jgi:hypothetical protein